MYRLEEEFKRSCSELTDILQYTSVLSTTVLTGLYNKEFDFNRYKEFDNVVVIDYVDGKNRLIHNGEVIFTIDHEFPKSNSMHDKARMEKMTYLRNVYLDYILSNKPTYGWSTMTVVDFDLDVNIEDIIRLSHKSLIQQSNYACTGVMSKTYNNDESNGIKSVSNGSVLYYDAYAYRPYPVDERYDTRYNKDLLHSILGGVMRDLIRTDKDSLRITSAFSGMASYWIDDLLETGAKYSTYNIGTDENEDYICEHVPLNEKLVMHIFKQSWVDYNKPYEK